MQPLEFQTVTFNFHDVIILMTALMCLFYGLLLAITNDQKVKSIYFLAAFLFAHTLIPINEVIMWGAEFKFHVRDKFPQIYFIPNLAYYIDTALLFLCIKSLIFKDFKLKKQHLLHLIPLLIYVIFILGDFYSLSAKERNAALWSENFVYSTNYVWLEFLCRLIRVGYICACFLLIIQYKDRLQDTQSNLEKPVNYWLVALIMGFLLVMLSETVLTGVKVVNLYHPIQPGYFFYIGNTVNYLTFALVNLLIFTAIRHFWNFVQVVDHDESDKPQKIEPFINPEMAIDVDKAMKEEKTFMEPDLTLESLADSLSMLPRDLSMLINRHFEINFYEFVNGYRIEEAKRMLIAPEYQKTTITDIYLAVGFNSKSVFYTFFKKFEGMTPSQYRQAKSK